MKDFEDVLVSLQVIMGDIKYKSELKKEKELEAERLDQDIERLRDKALELIQNNLEFKVSHSVVSQ